MEIARHHFRLPFKWIYFKQITWALSAVNFILILFYFYFKHLWLCNHPANPVCNVSPNVFQTGTESV